MCTETLSNCKIDKLHIEGIMSWIYLTFPKTIAAQSTIKWQTQQCKSFSIIIVHVGIEENYLLRLESLLQKLFSIILWTLHNVLIL